MAERPLMDWLNRHHKSSLNLDTSHEPLEGQATKIERVDHPGPATADHSRAAAPEHSPVNGAGDAADNVVDDVADEAAYSTLPCGTSVEIHHIPNESFDGPFDDDSLLGNLENFALMEWIGAGGNGLVYKAYDRNNDRPVAIKLLKSSAQAKELIANEAKRSSTNHPNLIVSHEYRSTSKHEFLVLEYLEGETLRQRAKREIKVRQVAEWGRQIASGLAALHARGIPHLDLKPENIMIREVNNNAVIIDVGLDRTAVAGGMHQALGKTPSYASPEQISGQVCGLPSDIYSFGVLMYELLTGRLPHAGDGETIKLNILHEMPERPCEVKEGLDKTLDCIVMKCLQKQPDNRYKSILEVAQDLQNWLQNHPTSVIRSPGFNGKGCGSCAILWPRRSWLAYLSFWRSA